MTQLLYLENTYFFNEQAQIIEVWNDNFGDYIILDRTIFYPQWWGQPSDTWKIRSWENTFQVTKCRLDEYGKVYHYGTCISWMLKIWNTTHLEIDQNNRILNARNHSAWHLLDVAMYELWYSDDLSPTKWYHFQDWAYVEYQWEFHEWAEIFIQKIEQKMKELTQQNIPIIVEYEWLWELEAPLWKTPRYVSFEGYKWCWCWGTHVKNSWEIREVSIRKVKYKKWILRVSYEITQ